MLFGLAGGCAVDLFQNTRAVEEEEVVVRDKMKNVVAVVEVEEKTLQLVEESDSSMVLRLMK